MGWKVVQIGKKQLKTEPRWGGGGKAPHKAMVELGLYCDAMRFLLLFIVISSIHMASLWLINFLCAYLYFYAEEMSPICEEIEVKCEPLWHSSEYEQVSYGVHTSRCWFCSSLMIS